MEIMDLITSSGKYEMNLDVYTTRVATILTFCQMLCPGLFYVCSRVEIGGSAATVRNHSLLSSYTVCI